MLKLAIFESTVHLKSGLLDESSHLENIAHERPGVAGGHEVLVRIWAGRVW